MGCPMGLVTPSSEAVFSQQNAVGCLLSSCLPVCSTWAVGAGRRPGHLNVLCHLGCIPSSGHLHLLVLEEAEMRQPEFLS